MLLNQCNASVFVQDDSNATPLLRPAWAGHAAVVRVILDHLKERHGQENDDQQQNSMLEDHIQKESHH